MQSPFSALQSIALRRVEEPDGAWLSSRIVDLKEGHELVVYAPHVEGEEVEMDSDTLLLLEVQQPQGIFRYAVRVRRRVAHDPPRLVLTWPERVERIQRREAVRVEVEVPVELLAHVEGQRIRMHCRTSDLSAGGLRLVVPEPLPEGTRVLLKLRVAGKLEMACSGTVLRGGEIPDRSAAEDAVWLGVQFVDLSEATRKELSRFVFDVEREQLRNRVD
jgi:c-di-GMP-binding flagellar brake protein YcgR